MDLKNIIMSRTFTRQEADGSFSGRLEITGLPTKQMAEAVVALLSKLLDDDVKKKTGRGGFDLPEQ